MLKIKIAVIVACCFFSVTALAKTDKIIRFQDESGISRYGIVNNSNIDELAGTFNDIANNNFVVTGRKYDLSKIKILPPVTPSKIINFGWTYPKHAKEVGGEEKRKEPLTFFKPPTVLIATGDDIIYPVGMSNQVEFEGELALIVGKNCKNVKPNDALKCIFGYTIFNDVTARDLTKSNPTYVKVKGFDTFGPLGPWIVTGINPSKLHIVTKLNGEIKQNGNTSEMSFTIPYLISYISSIMTLVPGDVIATGTPNGSAPMKQGDIVEVEISKIGVLKNQIK